MAKQCQTCSGSCKEKRILKISVRTCSSLLDTKDTESEVAGKKLAGTDDDGNIKMTAFSYQL